ncbi:MAG: quinol:electron acceptor oxidoreductase subunit ActD [Kofleriaceae bacterium]
MEADNTPTDEPTATPVDHGDAADHGQAGHGDGGSDEPTAGDRELHGLLAEFETPGALIAAARKVKNAGYTEFDCYSPFPVHGIDDAMGIQRTKLPLVVFAGGAAGLIGGLFLQWWMNAHNWPWIVAGKPTWSIPANVPIAYETTILLSVLTTFFGMWMANKLPQVWHPYFSLDRFAKVTDDGLMIGIDAKDQRFDLEQTKQLLVAAGATDVEECYRDLRPEATEVPKWIYGAMTVMTVLAIIPFALAAKARRSTSADPHWHIFSDMDFQPKAKSDQAFPEFADGRANRGEIAGTIARGSLDADDAYYRGLRDGQWITDVPADVTVDRDLLARGQGKFNIYCAPCHGYDGNGHGIVPERVAQAGGAWEARNLTAPETIKLPNGQLFNTVSNGYNTMMGYAAQIPVQDRWAIVLYVRALQRGQNATQAEIPAGVQVR